MSLPSSFRKKKPETDWKLRLFVFFLFIVIAAVVGFSHIYYYKLVLQVIHLFNGGITPNHVHKHTDTNTNEFSYYSLLRI